jgi:exoribonuclease R
VLYSKPHLEEIAQETSETERRAASAERELIDWKTAQYMEQHLGDEYDALIISVQKFGCFVELFEVFVEGLLPITALEEAAGTRVVYRESDHAMVAMADSAGSQRVGTGRGQSRRGEAGRGGSKRGKQSAQLSGNPLTWKLGDQLRVRAERIDPIRHRVEFSLVTKT